MDLVAGDDREILLGLAVDNLAGFDDRSRFPAHLSLGGGMDPTWLDLFSEAVRHVCASDQPVDFLDARRELDGPGDVGERTVERIDAHWITAIACVHDHEIDAICGRWIDLIEEELGQLPREEKPWIRQLTEQIVRFARDADRAPAVLFAWSI
jgi:hypothetical protein